MQKARGKLREDISFYDDENPVHFSDRANLLQSGVALFCIKFFTNNLSWTRIKKSGKTLLLMFTVPLISLGL